MKIIIPIIIFLFLINPVLAQETDESTPNWLTNLYKQTEKKIITPAKDMINKMKQKGIEQKGQEMLKNTQQTIEEKQEELLDQAQEKIKQETKKGIKNWFENKKQWFERKLAPLKNKIQEGSDLIREWINSLR